MFRRAKVNKNNLVSKKNSIVLKLLLVTVSALIILSLALTFIATVTLGRSIRNREKEALKQTAYALKNAYYIMCNGDFNNLAGQANIMQMASSLDAVSSATGENPDAVSSATEHVVDAVGLMNIFHNETGVTVSLFWGDTRILTTITDENGNYDLGTVMTEEVKEAVLSQGKEFFGQKVKIHDQDHYAFYLPLINEQAVLGAIEVAVDSAAQEKIVTDVRNNFMIYEGLITLVAIIVSFIIVRSIAAGIIQASETLHKLADGDLTVVISDKMLHKQDEIGVLTRATHHLRNKLTDIVTKLNGSINQLGKAADDLDGGTDRTKRAVSSVTVAMTEISKGAMAQAEDTYKANENILVVGEQINQIAESVNTLKDKAGDISKASEEAKGIVTKLVESSKKTMDAVDKIELQTSETNMAAESIRKALMVITDIAKKTKLLSLNSSIEASRAGEHGKGFAVVAGEIKSLAEQSDQSVKEISDIINNLLNESEKSLEAAKMVKDSIQDENIKLDSTKSHFDIVMGGIIESKSSIEGIYDKILVLENSRNLLLQSVESLSALSEEYAASTEETTANTEELNQTIGILAEKASELRVMSKDLETTLKVFNL